MKSEIAVAISVSRRPEERHCCKVHLHENTFFLKCLGNNIVPISCLQWCHATSQSNFHGILYVLKTDSLFRVRLFWYSVITALDRAPQHSTNPHNRIMLQAFYFQRLFAKAVLMPVFLFYTSRIYKQCNYISVRYTSDLQAEVKVVSVLNKHTKYVN